MGLCHCAVTSFTPKDWVWSQATPCGRQNDTHVFSPSTSVSSLHYNPTNTSYSFIHVTFAA